MFSPENNRAGSNPRRDGQREVALYVDNEYFGRKRMGQFLWDSAHPGASICLMLPNNGGNARTYRVCGRCLDALYLTPEVPDGYEQVERHAAEQRPGPERGRDGHRPVPK